MTATMTENVGSFAQFNFTDTEEMMYLASWLESESDRLAEDASDREATMAWELSKRVTTSAHECWEAMDLAEDEVSLILDVMEWRYEVEARLVEQEPWNEEAYKDMAYSEELCKEAKKCLDRF